MIALAVSVGGEETVRVAIREQNWEKIAHKLDRMGDFKPELVYERADLREIDPRDDAAVSEINRRTTTTCHRAGWNRSAGDRRLSFAR